MYIDQCKEPRLISHLKMCFIVLVYHNKMCRKLNLVFIFRIFIHLKQLLYLLPAIVSLFVYKLFFFNKLCRHARCAYDLLIYGIFSLNFFYFLQMKVFTWLELAKSKTKQNIDKHNNKKKHHYIPRRNKTNANGFLPYKSMIFKYPM